LTRTVQNLFASPEKLAQMRTAMETLRKPRAATDIAQAIRVVAEHRGKAEGAIA
jgi:UDP-N-acetylglucosamine:LPS N-acetylglucosamine transferase